MVYTTELQHYGIKGMKWGVRRYQNYDGSYTQAGMKRYNKSMAAYEKADYRYKTAKKSNASKTDLTNARMARKNAKHQLNKDYKHLKQDKLADQGKTLYSKGKTITGNSTVTSVMSKIGGLSLAAAAYNAKMPVRRKYVTEALTAVGVGSLTVAGVKQIADNYQAKRLRAYYSHTSNY